MTASYTYLLETRFSQLNYGINSFSRSAIFYFYFQIGEGMNLNTPYELNYVINPKIIFNAPKIAQKNSSAENFFGIFFSFFKILWYPLSRYLGSIGMWKLARVCLEFRVVSFWV